MRARPGSIANVSLPALNAFGKIHIVESSIIVEYRGEEMQRAKDLKAAQREELLRALKARFEKNMNRHKGLEWAKVKARLEANAEKLWSLREMERTGGEPDVVGHDQKDGRIPLF